jgi:hypothetical protein
VHLSRVVTQLGDPSIAWILGPGSCNTVAWHPDTIVWDPLLTRPLRTAEGDPSCRDVTLQYCMPSGSGRVRSALGGALTRFWRCTIGTNTPRGLLHRPRSDRAARVLRAGARAPLAPLGAPAPLGGSCREEARWGAEAGWRRRAAPRPCRLLAAHGGLTAAGPGRFATSGVRGLRKCLRPVTGLACGEVV